jgi:hypothetical protein
MKFITYIKYLPGLIILFVALNSRAQSQKIEIGWSGVITESIDGENINTLTFSGAEHIGEFGLLPVFVKIIKNPTQGLRYDFSLSDITYEPLVDDEFEDIDLIPGDLQTYVSNATIRQTGYSVFKFLPLRKNPANGSLEKVTSFSMDIQIAPDLIRQAPEADELFANVSALATGKWYKISVEHDGIYKVTYEFLDDLGVDLAGQQPEKIRLFGNGWGMLPEKNADYRPDDLEENAIMVFDGNDGTFDPGDYFLFFGQSPDKWVFNSAKGVYEHQHHLYSDYNYYFINIGNDPGKRIEPYDQQALEAEAVVTTYNDFAVHKLNERNLIRSGSQWYGEIFSDTLEQTFFFDLPLRDVTAPVHITGEFVARSTKTSNFFAGVNGDQIFQRSITAVPANSLTKYANSGSRSVWFESEVVPSLNVSVAYDMPETNSIGWLNYIEINFKNKLRFSGKTLRFRYLENDNSAKFSEFLIPNVNHDFRVWNINDPLHPKTIELTYLNDTATFILTTDLNLEFVAFDPTTYEIPEPVGEIPNQNLHAISSADFVIVSHPDFMDQAERLKFLHEEIDGMTVEVVDVNQVYNEFSSGSPDPSAIRDFARMVYLRSGSPPALKYLMLFGDGSYDPKNRIPDNRNFIIAYQSKQSLWPTATYVTDDFYGMMDPEEGVDANGNIDLGVGRLPANSHEEAKLMVDKIESYMRMRPEIQGHWRNSLCFIADDEDYNLHFYQADTVLVSVIERNNESVNINKIYLDAYPQQTTTGGQFYPDVNKAIKKQVNEGTLMVNYTGHGGELGLAYEKIMLINDIVSWENMNALPVFITATCEFSPFDNPEMTSAGEMVLLNTRGGGVALFSTTRRAFASSNLLLNRRIYDTLFRAYPDKHPRLGDLMMFSKNPSNSNIRNFVLLGNPALRLALPYHSIVTTSINEQPVHLFTDTLRANSKVTISGHIEHYQNRGEIYESFNGLIYPVLYDKPETVTTLGNDSKSFPVDFELQNSALYKGIATVENGRFSFTFMLPKDISFAYGNGKLSYYASDSLQDASGYFSDFVIGGSSDGTIVDNNGPEIELYLNDSTFASGSEVNNSPVFHARLSDPSGINWLSNSIGRDIILTMNGQQQQSLILNDHFEPEVNNYQSGNITFPFGKLQNGEYVLELRAWDLMNNSSSKAINFTISDSISLSLSYAYNYPNPFSDHTWFTFKHNQYNSDFDMKIEIFNFYGQLIETIGPEKVFTNGYSVEPVFWDGAIAGGGKLENGVYLYKMTITGDDGQVQELMQKMILTR